MKVRRVDWPRNAPSYFASALGNISGIFYEATIRCCVRTAGVGCVSAAPRFGTRQECRVSLRGFGLGLESGRVGDAPLPMLRPDGWDCHSPADVKDHAPQDITIGTPLLYQKPPEWAENVLAKSEALRNFRAKICHSIQLLLNIRLRCGRNRGEFVAGEIKLVDGTSASAKATKTNAPYGR